MPNILCDFQQKWEPMLLIFHSRTKVANSHPELNQVLTRKLLDINAKALDEIGSPILLKRIMMTLLR
jgi:hypothetical protein